MRCKFIGDKKPPVLRIEDLRARKQAADQAAAEARRLTDFFDVKWNVGEIGFYIKKSDELRFITSSLYSNSTDLRQLLVSAGMSLGDLLEIMDKIKSLAFIEKVGFTSSSFVLPRLPTMGRKETYHVNRPAMLLGSIVMLRMCQQDLSKLASIVIDNPAHEKVKEGLQVISTFMLLFLSDIRDTFLIRLGIGRSGKSSQSASTLLNGLSAKDRWYALLDDPREQIPLDSILAQSFAQETIRAAIEVIKGAADAAQHLDDQQIAAHFRLLERQIKADSIINYLDDLRKHLG